MWCWATEAAGRSSSPCEASLTTVSALAAGSCGRSRCSREDTMGHRPFQADLSGRLALVTGANSGMGKRIGPRARADGRAGDPRLRQQPARRGSQLTLLAGTRRRRPGRHAGPGRSGPRRGAGWSPPGGRRGPATARPLRRRPAAAPPRRGGPARTRGPPAPEASAPGGQGEPVAVGGQLDQGVQAGEQPAVLGGTAAPSCAAGRSGRSLARRTLPL
jgi:hypothetical protein